MSQSDHLPHTTEGNTLTSVELGKMSSIPAADASAHPDTHVSDMAVDNFMPGTTVVAPINPPSTSAEHEIKDTADVAEPISDPNDIQVPPPALLRQETEAIGPSTDLPTPMLGSGSFAVPTGPAIIINLLLTSTGTRHPYKIDQKYLDKRSVTAKGTDGAFDPFVISVYTLKELIWRDWRDEWDPRPSSPSAIRLIHFGRLLDDKLPLKECRFSDSTPNVVHVSVKPQDFVDDEENAKAGGKASSTRGRDGADRTPGCRCVIL